MFERETVIHRRVLFALVFAGLITIMPHENWPATLLAAAIATVPLSILLVWPYMLIALPLVALWKLVFRAMRQATPRR